MKTDACPKCGSTEWVRGRVYQQGGSEDVRFKANDASFFSFKKQVNAVACKTCGFIEFYLADPGA